MGDWVIGSLDYTISDRNKMGMGFIFLASSSARLQLPLSPTMTRAWEGPQQLQGLVSAATKDEPYVCCSHVRQGKFLTEKSPPHSVCFTPFLICSLVETTKERRDSCGGYRFEGSPGGCWFLVTFESLVL
ncbi:hypothetical protein R6Q59_036194 [Mikania micrantha]